MNKGYVEQVIGPLKELVLQDDISKIPRIAIATNSDLNIVASNVSSLAVSMKNSESDAEQISDIFESIGNYFQDERNINMLSFIDYTSKSFASIFEQSYTILNSKVIPIVDDLKSKITLAYQNQLLRENADNLLSSPKEPSESDYTFLNWNVSEIDRREVIEIACSNANLNVKELSKMNLSYIVAKLVFGKEFTHIDLPIETKTIIFDKLIPVFDKLGINDAYVKRFFGLVIDIGDYNNFFGGIQTKLRNSVEPAQLCLEMVDMVHMLTVFTMYFKQEIADSVTADTLETIAANSNVIMKSLYAIKYWILFMKEVRFKNQLLLTKNIINAEAYENFVREGRSIGDIYNYLKAFFHNTRIPSDGIAMATVVSSDVGGRLEKINRQIKSNETFTKSKCLINAFNQVIQQFVNDEDSAIAFEALKDKSVKLLFIKTAVKNSAILGGNIDLVDNVLYQTILSMFFNDNIVGTMYRYLGKNFVDLIDTTDDIDSADILNAQCSALIELMVNFLFTKGICYSE